MLPRRRKREKTKPYEGPWRCPSYLQFVRGFECAIARHMFSRCEGPVQAAHARTGTDGSMGQKPSDWWAIPLCKHHHDEQHGIGEPAFERRYGIDMRGIARGLYARWQRTTSAGQRYRRQHEKESA